MNDIENLTLKWAEKYISLGWSLIPLKPKSKEPLIPWQEFQTRRADMKEIEGWIKKWPEMNLGVVSGRISGLVVVDLDGLEGKAFGLKEHIVGSVVSLTGNGKQIFHKWTEHVDNSVAKIAPGVDIRGDGGYVVVAPSVHPSGRRYRWERFVLERLQDFPMGIMNVKSAEMSDGILAAKAKPAGWIAKALEEMKIGNIDDTLFKICSRLRHDGLTEADAYTLLQPHAERVGASPSHLGDKIRNVWGRYEPKARYDVQQMVSKQAGSLILHSPTNPDSLIEYNKRQMESDSTRITTGYNQFDTITKGLKKGEVLTVAARTGVGKTNWVITPIRQFCEQGKKVLLFSTEMSFDQIWQRYQAALSEIHSFDQHQFFICDEFTPDIERIEEAIKNVTPDLFVFDHISHIGTDYHIISRFMSEIKRLTRLYGIPAIVTAQLNRNADYVDQGQRVEPRLSMIQGSDQIGQMSAQVLLLNEKRVTEGNTEIEGIIVKNRHGDKGMVQFILKSKPYYRMEEVI